MAEGAQVRPSRQEPLFWSLFSAGGTVAALLFPVHVVILGIVFAFGGLEDPLAYERIIGIVRFPLTKIYLGVLISLPLFHAAHRLRFTVHHELGIHGGKALVATLLYGAAVVGTGFTVWILVRI